MGAVLQFRGLVHYHQHCSEHWFDLNKVRQGDIIEIGSALTKLREGNILKWFDVVVC